jgi:porin
MRVRGSGSTLATNNFRFGFRLKDESRAGRGSRIASPARFDMRAAPTLALLLATALPLAAHAAGPAPNVVAQRLPLTAVPPDAGRPEASPGDRNSPLGVSPGPQNTTGSSSTEIGGPPTPISNVPRVGLFPELGKILLDRGFDFHGVAFSNVRSLQGAGVRTHETEHLLAIAPILDVDLGKAAGITGGNIHLTTTFLTLRANEPNYVTDAGGALVGNQQGVPALSGHFFYLSQATYEQRLLNDRLSIEVGQTSAYRYFFLPNSLDPLTHYSTTIQVNGDFPTTPFPTWGGRATYKLPSSNWYLQAGAFEDNFRRATNYPLAFGSRGSSGAQVLAEVGYRSEFSNAAYPANLEVGVEYNTRSGYSNAKGSPAPALQNLTVAANYPGGGVIYAQGLQTLWRGASNGAAAPPANINVYGSFDVAYDKPQPIDFDAIVGFNFTGLIPGRPFDALGIQAHYQQLSKTEGAFESRAHNFFAGPGKSQRRNGMQFETVGNIQLTPAIAVRPLVEYFVNPDNIGDARGRRRPSNGFEVGVFTVVSLARLLGTSAKPF